MTEQATSLTDEGLLAELRQKNPEAFNIVVERYKDPLTACARWLVGENPEEAYAIVRSVFLRLYFTGRVIRRIPNLTSWLFGETIRLARFRSRQHHLTGVLHSWVRRKRPSGNTDPLQEYLQRGFLHDRESPEVAIARERIDALPATLREVVVLREFLELSCDEIGGILDLSPAVVESRAGEARALLDRNSHMGPGE
jgi:RNA polymerase sigma-70 factor (ECF subfamily)